MKRLWIVALVLVALAPACKKSATAPTGVTQPTQFIFGATLLPANEVPAATGPETSGSGTATITLNVTRDGSGTITAANITFVVNLSSFPAGTSFTAAHIHPGASGVAGSVLINTGLANGEVVTNSSGAGSFTKTAVTLSAIDAQSIITNPAGFYFNIHTSTNSGGVARGQMSLTSSH